MLYLLVAVLLLAHSAFWGAGLGLLILPRAWRRAWWAFAVPLGFALQSAVVWIGAHLPVTGTQAYGRFSELLPLVLLIWAWRRRRVAVAWRSVAVAAALMMVAVLVLAGPMGQRAGWTLTTSSLGSCDQADYAAGARVLLEFARADRVGFLDLPEVTKIGPVDRFFDYWLKLNHFSPSALIAHNAAVFGLEPYQLVSVTAAVFWAALVPAGLLLARALGWPAGRRWAVGLLWAVSPLGAYAVHHGAMGQMLATQGIVLLTLVAVGRLRRPRLGAGAAFAVALAACWLIAGSYNFIFSIALAPVLAGVVLVAWTRGEMRAIARGLAPIALALVAIVPLVWGRFEGLLARFQLLKQYSFGWPVPIQTPEGWLGLVRDAGLQTWPVGVRVVLVAVLGLAVIAAWAVRAQRDRRSALTAFAWFATVLGGWAMLVWESRGRENASYDAFKVVTVFLPLLLPVLLGWWAFATGKWRWVAGLGLAAVIAGNAPAGWAIAQRMADPPLRVEGDLVSLRRFENMPRVKSLNLRIEEFWSRLWANAFLLRKPHYFPTHTYEARLNTPLVGAWDVRDSFFRALPVAETDFVELTGRFYLVRAGVPGLVEGSFGAGWRPPEEWRRQRWRWLVGPAGTLTLRNDAATAVQVEIELEWRGHGAQDVRLGLAGGSVARFRVGLPWQKSKFTVSLPPGETTLELAATPVAGGAPDPQRLSVALSGVRLRTLP